VSRTRSRGAVVPSMPIKAIEHDHPECLVRTTALVEVLMHAVGAVRQTSTQASGSKQEARDLKDESHHP
jgi:hypothetical protein